MKRLLCILGGMNTGGAETFLMKLYRHLDRTRFQLDFCINHQEKQDYEDEILAMGGKIHRIPTKSENLKGFKNGLFNVVKSGGYQHVLRITSNAMGFLDLKIAHDAGAKVCAVRTSSAGGDLGLKEKIAHRFGRLMYGRYVNLKLAPSDLAAIHTFGRRAYERGEVRMLRNAVDLDVFRYDSAGALEVRRRFHIPEDSKVVGHVGQLRKEKNHAFLLRVFANLCKCEPDCRLLLVGGGDQEPTLRRAVDELGITDKVIFAGVQREVTKFLSAMDVMVFPSFYEGMPNTVIEAQATGLPCVLSDTITREANITGLVKYVPLSGGLSTWCTSVRCQLALNRKNMCDVFVKHGYDIRTATRRFEQLVFT